MKRLLGLCAFFLLASTVSAATIVINEAKGWFESAYVTWHPVTAASYRVYCQAAKGEYKEIDGELIRNYGRYGRADVLGLAVGEYRFKIVGVDSLGNEIDETTAESDWVMVKEHDRSGFAHLGYKGVGAYNDDGTLKENAKVLYVTAETAKSIACDVITNNKGSVKEFVGLQTIIDARQKGYDMSPLAIRIIGTIKAEDMDKFSSSAEGLQIKGKNAYSEMNITIEGVGNDATLHGFGMLIRNCMGVEVRNLGIMLCMDDCISIDTGNSHCWVHHVDFFYGQTGGDSDQAKGDGSLDCKGDSRFMTFSYNHFWDCGKMALCGMTSESGENYISYHHNWFDHSDSRHPRVRTMTVHVYNNYFDGIAKYGIGATMGSSVFVENNYFRNTSRPMLISLQGTDVAFGKGTFSGENGGMIKAYGNVYAERTEDFKLITHKESATHFDCYEAETRDEWVPERFVALAGGTAYNNFDLDRNKMYDYIPDPAGEVPSLITGFWGAGRLQKGDFRWTFDNNVDDADYGVNMALKKALEAYQTTLIGRFSPVEGNTDSGDMEDTGKEDSIPEMPENGDYSCHFMDRKPSNDFYSVQGNYSDSKGIAVVNGKTYSICLKIESSTSVAFTTVEEMTLLLVFAEGSTPNIKIDGEKISSNRGNVIYHTLKAGTHEITKADVNNLFYIDLLPNMSAIKNQEQTYRTIYRDLGGRIVYPHVRGIYIRNGKKVILNEGDFWETGPK